MYKNINIIFFINNDKLKVYMIIIIKIFFLICILFICYIVNNNGFIKVYIVYTLKYISIYTFCLSIILNKTIK